MLLTFPNWFSILSLSYPRDIKDLTSRSCATLIFSIVKTNSLNSNCLITDWTIFLVLGGVPKPYAINYSQTWLSSDIAQTWLDTDADLYIYIYKEFAEDSA